MHPLPIKRILLCAMVVYAFVPVSAQKKQRPDNIILMIGDGMGVAHVYAGYTANHGTLNLFTFPVTGFSKTYSASDYITDSGAAATAISTGNKTFNGAIGVGNDSVPAKTILEYAEEKGLSTGLVATSTITHATPASFIAHQADRDNYEAIANDFLKTDIDVFIGGGLEHFSNRKDGRNLLQELRRKGYQVILSLDSIRIVSQGKLAGFTSRGSNPSKTEGRGNELPDATGTALKILSRNKKGFFLMVEGSQIDWGAHANNTESVVNEVLDFDKAVGIALEFARNDGHTLVIVTADHETGGMMLQGGDDVKGTVEGKFCTTGHSGVMVPVFAFGPGAERFQGVQENTDMFKNMMRLYGF